METVYIPSFETWRSDTSIWHSIGRSAELQKLDNAIKAFHFNKKLAGEEARLKDIADAWKAWEGKTRSDNKTFGKRNKNFAVWNLQKALAISGLLVPKPPEQKMPLSKINLQFDPSGTAAEHAAVDMAFIEVEVALNAVVELLRRSDPAMVALVKLWFGNTELQKIYNRFSEMAVKLRDYKENSPAGEVIRIKLGKNGSPGVMARVQNGNMKYGIELYKPFFSTDMAQVNTYMFKRMVERRTQIRFLQIFEDGLKVIDKVKEEEKKIKELGQQKPLKPHPVSSVDELTLALGANTMRYEKDNRTRFGIIIHELTHIFFNTIDVKVGPKLLKIPSLDLEYDRLGQCYGGTKCALLAKSNPDQAFQNADNYRLFVESCHF